MQCPNCHAEVRDGAAFCGSCGATIEQPSAPSAAAAPPPQPTTPMPAPMVPDQAAYEQAVYAQQMAEYERQKAAYDQAQYAQQQAAYTGQYAQQPPAAPPKKKTGCVVAIVIILILLLIGCSVGGFFAYKALKDKADEALEITTPDTGDADSGDTGSGESGDGGNLLDSYPTADEAVAAQLASSGVGDWIYQVYDEGDGYATYWAGPPNSEFVDQIYLEQNADGTWSVIEVSSIGYGGDVSGGATADEAMAVVDEHLSYVMGDMGLEAQSLTIDPFRSDAAAAQVSAGGFDYYTIDGYEEQSDGTFWVQTTQSWYGTVEGWQYYVVPTEAGYRIANIELIQ